MTAVDLRVVPEHGQWSVYLVRLEVDGTTRELITTCRTQREAQVLADGARRSAYRRNLMNQRDVPMRGTTGHEPNSPGQEGDRR